MSASRPTMLGAEGVTRLLLGRLYERLPEEVAVIREDAGVTEEDLPGIQEMRPYVPDVQTIERWPSVFVTFVESNPVLGSGRLESSSPEADHYRYRYRNRAYVFARGETQAQTDLRLKRYLLALRQALIRHKQLTEFESEGPHARIESTLRETMSDVGLDPNSKRYIGGAYTEVDVITTEALGPHLAADGAAETLAVHPALM